MNDINITAVILSCITILVLIFNNEVLKVRLIKLNFTHGKNDFTKISKNLARYRSENNFVCDPLK